METLRELEDLLRDLSTGKKIKVNVHFTIPEPLASYCIDFNRAINRIAPSLIQFKQNSIAFPHITLFMGFVNSYTMLENVFHSVEDMARNMQPFRITAMQPYFKGVSKRTNQYLFIDMLQNDDISAKKENFFETLSNCTIPIGWDLRGERPHISVSCHKFVTGEIRDFVENYPLPPECDIRHIGISISGKHGICLGQLKMFELR